MSKIEEESSHEHPALDHAEAVVALHIEQTRLASPHQRAVENLTSWLGRPFLLYGVIGVTLFWLAFNLVAHAVGLRGFDKPPFQILQAVMSFASLLVTVTVLITQNRLGKVEQRQDQLMLQLSLLADHKTAKIIALLEELRRDLPEIPNRIDPEAEALTETVSAEALASELGRRLDEGEAQVGELERLPAGE